MKRLLILLLACCMFVMSGCGERGDAETPKPDTTPQVESGESSASKPLPIENAQLAENFQLVCDQIGIEASKTTNWEQTEDWIGGPSYLFEYEGAQLRALFGIDDIVEAIMLSEQELLYSYRSGTYMFDDFVPEPEIYNQVENIAQGLLKQECGVPEDAVLPITEASVTRSISVYNYFGYMDMNEEDGSAVSVAFVFAFEHDEEAEQLHLRYFSFGDSVIQDKLSEIILPETTAAMPQKETPIVVDDGEILIEDGKIGEYGREFDYGAEEKAVLFYIPAGTYSVRSLIPGCEIIIQNENSFVDEYGYAQYEEVSKVTLSSNCDEEEITIKEGEHIATSFFAKAVLKPIQ